MRRARTKRSSYAEHAAGILTEVSLVFAIFIAAGAIIWALGWLAS